MNEKIIECIFAGIFGIFVAIGIGILTGMIDSPSESFEFKICEDVGYVIDQSEPAKYFYNLMSCQNILFEVMEN